jgi:hypothetical protein
MKLIKLTTKLQKNYDKKVSLKPIVTSISAKNLGISKYFAYFDQKMYCLKEFFKITFCSF